MTAKAGLCPCGSHLPAICLKGRTNDILNFKILDERTVTLFPLALGMAIEETPRGEAI